MAEEEGTHVTVHRIAEVTKLTTSYSKNYKSVVKNKEKIESLRKEIEELEAEQSSLYEYGDELREQINEIISMLDDTPENRNELIGAIGPLLLEITIS